MNVVEDDWVDVQTTTSALLSQPPQPQPQPQPQQPQQPQPQQQPQQQPLEQPPQTPQGQANEQLLVKDLEEKLQQSIDKIQQQQRLSQHHQQQHQHRIQQLQLQLKSTQQELATTQEQLNNSQQQLTLSNITIQQQKQQLAQLATLVASPLSSSTPSSLSKAGVKESRKILIKRLKRQQDRVPLSNSKNQVLAIAPKVYFRQQSGSHRSVYSQDRHHNNKSGSRAPVK